MSRDAVTTDGIAPPIGPFSPAIRSGDFIFLSGQVGLSPLTRTLITGDIAAQAEQIFANIRIVLGAAGRTLADVVKVNVFLTTMDDFARLNAIYERHFVAPYPARTTIAVAALPLGAAVEIDLIARA